MHEVIKKKLKILFNVDCISLQNRAIPAWMHVKKLTIK